jgi:1-acyl-sn-glycerol-3-phosphate acyltransferase
MTATVPAKPSRSGRFAPGELPPRWPWLFRLFRRYSRRYAAKHLHTVRLSKAGRPPARLDGPAIIVLNHPSWWDPLVCFILSGLFVDRIDWAPIEAASLRRYCFLARVGMFPVETGRARGAVEFLRTARAVLADPRATLWVTAQGRFADVRERPVRLRSGVGHLAERLGRGVILPLALEYTFWGERTPEVLARFGQPIDVAAHPGRPARECTSAVAVALEGAQDALAAEAARRDPAAFDVVVSGRAGVGGVYDVMRRLGAWVRGERFRAEHTPTANARQSRQEDG